jgi:hypothetical protein
MNEKKLISIFQDVFNAKFDKAYPSWLKNKHGTQLELDGYNEALNLAFEYNGPFHYDQKYYETKEKYEIKKASDAIKKELCKENNVFLIVIPYTVKYNELYDYVMSRLHDAFGEGNTLTIPTKKGPYKVRIPLDHIYMNEIDDLKLH